MMDLTPSEAAYEQQRARYIRLLNILNRICNDISNLEDDEYYADYDQAVAAAKKLLFEEVALLTSSTPRGHDRWDLARG